MTTPLLQAVAAAALGVGVPITSVSNSSLNATYPIDDDAQAKLLGTFAYTVAFSSFPAGQTTWTVKDINGLNRTVTSLAQFQAFCRALADYVARLDLIIDNIDTTSTALPNPPPPIP